jgi:hypothetical protein
MNLRSTPQNEDELLTLFLLMLRVGANHPHDALAADDLAILANPPNTATHLHGKHLHFIFVGKNRSEPPNRA